MSDSTVTSGAVEADAQNGRIRHVGRRQGFSPYPKYKPTGVEWLEEVPEHWEIDALCRVTTDIRASNVDKHVRSTEIAVKLCNYVDVYYNESIDTQINYMHGSATSRQIDIFRLREGDVLITKDSEVQDDIGVPALVTEHVPDLIAGYHLVLVRPDLQCLYGPYLFRALQSDIASLQFTHCAQGVTRYGMTYSGIRSVRLPIPPLAEQRAIAAYLDRETAKIDALIAKNEVLIERLKEQRAALISRTVTRGLPPNESRKAGIDPHPKLKPSGVEWLGDVPEHWEVRRLKTIFYEIDERNGDGKRELLSLTKAHGLVPRTQPNRKDGTASTTLAEYKICRPGILVMNRMQAWRGMFASTSHEGIVSPDYAVFGLIDHDHSIRYFEYLLKTHLLVQQFGRWSRGIGSGFNRLYTDDFGAISVPCPPVAEQAAVAVYLDHTAGRIDIGMSLVHRELRLLREYRTRLISDVVTGKIDVR